MLRTYLTRGTVFRSDHTGLLRLFLLFVLLPLCWLTSEATAQTISGTKFEDLNGDGIQNVGEGGMAGWTIIAYNTATGTTVATVTAVNGSYNLMLSPGTWIIREVQQPGWTQSTPQRVTHTVTLPGMPTTGWNFGNRPACRIPGNTMIYMAGNPDSFTLPTEPSFIDGQLNTFLITNFSPALPAAVFDRLTGAYSFGHSFTGLNQPGCFITGAKLIVQLRALGANSVDDVIGFAQDSTGVWRVPISTLYGAPWIAPPPINFTDTLDLAALAPSTTGVVNILAALADGDLDFFVSDRTAVDFLRLEVTYCCSIPSPGLGAIEGIKFHDLNANGARDAGEPGLPNWTIKAKNTTTGQVIAVQTGSAGSFTFANVTAGTWSVYEEQQNGWVQTAPAGVFYRAVVTTGNTVSGMSFGNAVACEIRGEQSETAGLADNFTGGTEPNDPDSELLTAMGTVHSTSAGFTAAGFDDATGNRIFGHTFRNLISGDCYIAGATLTLKLKTLAGDSNDDRFAIVQGTTAIWESSVSALFNNMPWSSTGGTVVLNLGSMPASGNAVNNLLAALQDNDFDFFFYDDSSIDYATLSVEYCCFEASLEGAKYNDLNNNGVRDSGEPGLAGWVITAQHSSGQTTTATTDGSGNYFFPSITTGTWTIFETQQSGWTQTEPSTVFHRIAVPSDPTITGINFGNVLKCDDPTTVRDTVGVIDNFSQANGEEHTNPSQEMDDYMYSIYTYASSTELDDDISRYDRIIGHTFTDYLPEGCYVTDAKLTIKLRNQDDDGDNDRIGFAADGVGVWSGALVSLIPGWSTVSTIGTIVLHLDSLPGASITNVLAALQDGDLDFYVQDDAGIDYAILEVQYCCYVPVNYFRGRKFNDLDYDGVRDPGEPGISGWRMVAYNPSTGDSVVVFTDANGDYELPVDDGTWVVYETQNPSWVQTAPLPVFYKEMVSGGQENNGREFGNIQKCSNPQTFQYPAGQQDEYEYEGGADMSNPGGGLLAYMNTLFPGSGPSSFDNPTPNTPFGHTFTNLQRPGCYIVGARLTIAMKALMGPSSDDVISFVQNGQDIWSLPISDIVGSPWINPIGNGTYILDLRDLDSSDNHITDIIASLMDGTLDVLIYDNTSVDYMLLAVDYCCPTPPVSDKLGANDNSSSIPATGVQPNPFSDHTVISYELRETGPVRFVIYNALGTPVYSLDLGTQNTGVHQVRWDGVNTAGAMVADGVYMYRIETPGGSITGQMVLQK